MRGKGRVHHTQVMPEQLTRAFQDVREAAGDNPPSFHRIRSLGGALLSDSDWAIEEVLGRMGTRRRRCHLEGDGIPWQEVQMAVY